MMINHRSKRRGLRAGWIAAGAVLAVGLIAAAVLCLALRPDEDAPSEVIPAESSAVVMPPSLSSQESEPVSQSESESLPEPSSSQSVSSEEPEAEPEESGASSAEEESSGEQPDPISGDALVPEGEEVDNSYFDDAVFVGDSITSGIALYGVMANTKVLAAQNINLASVYTSPAIRLKDGSKATIMDAIAGGDYRKIYVMLGGNEIRDESEEAFLTRYGKLIDDLGDLYPDAILYIQSILPVTKNNRYRMDNARIDRFNAALLDLCSQKGVYYLNVAESFKDEDGMLPDSASPTDGMHFGTAYYEKWFAYLRKHALPVQAE